MRRMAIGLAVALGLASPALAADPWAPPSDMAAALRDPDRFAWQMFVALTWPADPGSRLPATDRPYGSPGPVMFETFALSEQVYLPRGAEPPVWEATPWAGTRMLNRRPIPRQLTLFRQVDPAPAGGRNHKHEEVRMNRAAFDYIRGRRLYSIEGQQRAYYAGDAVSFPADAIEVKAVWRPIREEDKARYQWTTLRDPGSGRSYNYGLTALHVASKALPEWLWATFEHVENPYRGGIHDEGWLNPSRDSAACPAVRLDCNLVPKDFGLEGTRWEFYRLRGTQVSYADTLGRPTILANSEIETGFQQSSSCISCHGRATIGPSVNAAASFAFGPEDKRRPPAVPEPLRLPIFRTLADGQVASPNGPPQPGDFLLPGQSPGGTQMLLRLDFVWSFLEAQSENAPAPNERPAR